MAECKKCGAHLSCDEMAIYRRLVYRDAEEFLCKKCLAAEFKIDEAEIDTKIAHFKSIGCTLFG